VPRTRSAIAWNAWGNSHPGRHRGNNEDRIYCDGENGIFVVADGMGGEAAGEVAAQTAVDFIRKRLQQQTGTVARRIREAIAGANNEINRLAAANPAWRGMACVLTVAVVSDGTLHVGHVGDTRLYKIRGGEIRKITPDHSPVGKREDAGELTELEAMRHPRRNEVYRDIGSQPHKPEDDDFIEYIQVPFERDSALLLCSDGLSDMLTSSEILAAFDRNAGSPESVVRDLIESANAAGGKDNVSAVVVEGDEFAPTVSRSEGLASIADPLRSKLPPRVVGILSGRWAFLGYGLIAGFLLAIALRPHGQPGVPALEPAEPAAAAPRVLVVEKSSDEFPTIGKALEKARPGDLIEVRVGEYPEAIRLKDGVDIAARSPGAAVIQISRPLPGIDAAISAEGISRASVSGLVIRATPAAGLPIGIRIRDSNISLSNVEVTGAVRAAILLEGSSAGTLAGNYIHANAGSGIVISGAGQPSVVGNVIENNGISRDRPSPGIYVVDIANPEVARNVFSGNGGAAIRVQRPELRALMMNNLFVGSGRQRKTVEVERARP
jgi:parallel beta-helix repeat protein